MEFRYLTWNILQSHHTLTLNPKSETDPNHNPKPVAYFPCKVVKLQEHRRRKMNIGLGIGIMWHTAVECNLSANPKINLNPIPKL